MSSFNPDLLAQLKAERENSAATYICHVTYIRKLEEKLVLAASQMGSKDRTIEDLDYHNERLTRNVSTLNSTIKALEETVKQKDEHHLSLSRKINEQHDTLVQHELANEEAEMPGPQETYPTVDVAKIREMQADGH